VGLVVRYSLSHPVWSGTLVGNTHLLCDIRRADVGDYRLQRQLNMVYSSHMSALTKVEEHGFSILTAVFLSQEIHKLINDISNAGLKRSKAGARHALKSSAVARLASDPRLLNAAQTILGCEATPFRATLFDKSPQANWLVVWHQDTALPLRERRSKSGWGPWSVKDGIIYAHAPASVLRQVLALRVHLDESSLHNGPLRILPGTHTNGVFTDDNIQALAAKVTPFDCVVPQGGVLVMRPLVVHASSKSQSQVPRRIVHIEYTASKVLDGFELAVA